MFKLLELLILPGKKGSTTKPNSVPKCTKGEVEYVGGVAMSYQTKT